MKTIKASEDIVAYLLEGKKNGEYVNHITNQESKLGEKVIFKTGIGNSIKMKCCQIGGMFSGTHRYIPE